MCIIGYAPKGKKISDDRLEVMFQHNPDGAGIMWKPKEDGPVEIRKGFMTFKSFLEVWHTIPSDCERAVHFRIASHGKINQENCHPFPIRQDINDMVYLEDKENAAVMHNGIIAMTSPAKGREAQYSDTMIFASDILANIDDLNNPNVDKMLEKSISGSRMIIFQQGKPTVTLGYWVEDDGCMYSNTSFRPYTTYVLPQGKGTKGKAKQSSSCDYVPYDYAKVPVKDSIWDDIEEVDDDSIFWDDLFYGKY